MKCTGEERPPKKRHSEEGCGQVHKGMKNKVRTEGIETKERKKKKWECMGHLHNKKEKRKTGIMPYGV